jgi:hypothetical protein
MATMLRSSCVLLLVGSLGCGFSHIDRDQASRPETVLGTRATILMPGEAPPPMGPLGGSPAGSGSSAATPAAGAGQSGGGTVSTQQSGNAQSGSSTSHGGGSAGGSEEMTMLGGSSGETEGETRTRDVPLGPLAVLFGYPYWLFGKKPAAQAAEAAAERAGELERSAVPDGAPIRRGPDDVERARLEQENARMARELGSPEAAPTPAVGGGAPSALRDELAALERTIGSGAHAGAPAREAVDRNRDGRPDLWSQREPAGSRRELVDDDGDGRAERALYYDADRRLSRVEEDLDGDGQFETTSLYENGQVSRRRADSDGDGQTDAWSYFEAGEMVRHEVDNNHDGFRDLVMHYRAGELVREELDRNGDGRPDLVTHYRDGQLAERQDDVDYDGVPDVASYYKDGKLIRRDASSEQALRSWESEAER